MSVSTQASLRSRLATVPRPAVYPIALAVLAPVSMYNGVASQLALDSAIRAIVVAGLIGLVVTITCTVILRDKDRGGLVAAVVIMVLGWGSQPGLLLLPIILLAFLGLEVLMRRHGRPPLPWSFLTRLMSFGVWVILGANIIAAAQTVEPWNASRPIETGLASNQAEPAGDLPDVYLILLDGHARLDTMEELDIPTDVLLSGLAANEMTLSPEARSSYGFTSLVLGSMFNGDHLDILKEDGTVTGTETGGVDTWNAIQRGTMIERFREAGYEINSVSSIFDHVQLRSADRYIDTGQLSLFEFKLLNRGLFRPLIEQLSPELPFDDLRSRIKDEFRVTADLAGQTSAKPRLIFTHIPAPHTPLVFRADGSARPSDGLVSYENDAPYMAQVGLERWSKEYGGHTRYIDELAMETVSRIAEQDPEAVIVLFSDHGHQWIRFPHGNLDDEPWPEFGDMEQRTKVLLAARTPGKSVLEPDTSLVNVLGRILDAYAGQPWTDRPDRYFDCAADGARCTPWTPGV